MVFPIWLLKSTQPPVREPLVTLRNSSVPVHSFCSQPHDLPLAPLPSPQVTPALASHRLRFTGWCPRPPKGLPAMTERTPRAGSLHHECYTGYKVVTFPHQLSLTWSLMFCLILSSQTLAKCLCLVFSPMILRRTGDSPGPGFLYQRENPASRSVRRLSHVSCWDS